MKVLANRHVGIIVHNFDKMLDFYIGLGFELRRRDLEEGPFVEKLLNADSIILETAKLVLQDENIPIHYRFNLELMKIANAESDSKDNLINIDDFDFNEFKSIISKYCLNSSECSGFISLNFFQNPLEIITNIYHYALNGLLHLFGVDAPLLSFQILSKLIMTKKKLLLLKTES